MDATSININSEKDCLHDFVFIESGIFCLHSTHRHLPTESEEKPGGQSKHVSMKITLLTRPPTIFGTTNIIMKITHKYTSNKERRKKMANAAEKYF